MKVLHKTTSRLGIMQAHLFVGLHEQTVERVLVILREIFCVGGGHDQCLLCKELENRQHHAVMWLFPSAYYTLDQFDQVLAKLTIELDEEEQFFIIIQKADFLSQMCANRLLKVLEEPPRGYYFFLLAERLDDVIPTIQSRCVVSRISGETSRVLQQNLFDSFTTIDHYNPILFAQHLQQSEIIERESVELFDKLIAFWSGYYKQSLTHNDEIGQRRAYSVLKILKRAATMLPMPGSSKFFWKNLYLQMETSLN